MERKKKKFENLVEEIKKNNTSNYDCVIPVSGGKDSYFQTHKIVKEYGLKPLLVTYHGNNYLPEGDFNRDNMRKVFDADHIVWGPSINVLIKLNKLGFEKWEIWWHAHCGILVHPYQLQRNLIYHLFLGKLFGIFGMYDPNDFRV